MDNSASVGRGMSIKTSKSNYADKRTTLSVECQCPKIKKVTFAIAFDNPASHLGAGLFLSRHAENFPATSRK
jgi:hypothetical protein